MDSTRLPSWLVIIIILLTGFVSMYFGYRGGYELAYVDYRNNRLEDSPLIKDFKKQYYGEKLK
jgi:hypothetical protein